MAKSEYLEQMRRRYRKARTRAEKTKLLDEICATCGYHRKHAVRALRRRRSAATAPRKPRGPKRAYHGKELLRPLKIIWLQSNQPCSKRLKALLPLWLAGLRDGVR
jgi:hypothetical protein